MAMDMQTWGGFAFYWFAILMIINLGLRWLASLDKASNHMAAQFRAYKGHAYVVPLLGQLFIVPMGYYLAISGELSAATSTSDWWFGSAEHEPTLIYVYLCAYFAADSLAHLDQLEPLILLHHTAGVISCVLVEQSLTWRGAHLTTTFIFELGSLGYNVNDIAFGAKHMLNPFRYLMYVTSAGPIMWTLWTAAHQPPSTIADMFLMAGVLIGGSVRLLMCKNINNGFDPYETSKQA